MNFILKWLERRRTARRMLEELKLTEGAWEWHPAGPDDFNVKGYWTNPYRPGDTNIEFEHEPE